MEANTFQPRCVAFTWRFVTLNNGTMASVFVPLICLCVSASSLSPPSIESRQLKDNCWLHGPSDKGEGLRWIPNYQPARGAERERGSKTTTGKSKVELAGVPKQAWSTSSLVATQTVPPLLKSCSTIAFSLREVFGARIKVAHLIRAEASEGRGPVDLWSCCKKLACFWFHRPLRWQDRVNSHVVLDANQHRGQDELKETLPKTLSPIRQMYRTKSQNDHNLEYITHEHFWHVEF